MDQALYRTVPGRLKDPDFQRFNALPITPPRPVGDSRLRYGPTHFSGAENIPRRPFAQAGLMPAPGTWVGTPWYHCTEFFRYFSHGRQITLETQAGQDSHGFDQNDGQIQVEWGFKKRWAADVTLGFTSAATRSFSKTPDLVTNTSGRSDTVFGIRYEAARESEDHSGYMPDIVLRAGGGYAGSHDKEYQFAPGSGSVGIEPSVVALKRFGWEGFGAYSHPGYRYMRSGGHDQWFAAIGAQQEIGRWTLNLGYRHFANTAGVDIGGAPPNITDSRQIMETAEQLEGGFGYRDRDGRLYQFYLRKTIDGNNTSGALVFGVYTSFAFGSEKH